MTARRSETATEMQAWRLFNRPCHCGGREGFWDDDALLDRDIHPELQV
ncbi:hypothetical protein [Corynebacterium sp. ACRPH]|nr:hypothetical protein [Corynebacterium sp. ACRPH]